MAIEGNALRAVTPFAAGRCETVVEQGAAAEHATARDGPTETDGGTVASVGASDEIGPDLFPGLFSPCRDARRSPEKEVSKPG